MAARTVSVDYKNIISVPLDEAHRGGESRGGEMAENSCLALPRPMFCYNCEYSRLNCSFLLEDRQKLQFNFCAFTIFLVLTCTIRNLPSVASH